MNPLKQGLKQPGTKQLFDKSSRSLSMNPLKQGLKLNSLSTRKSSIIVFIHESIKTRVETLKSTSRWSSTIIVFIHESIKTRVETARANSSALRRLGSLSMNPLKQGLKQLWGSVKEASAPRLYP